MAAPGGAAVAEGPAGAPTAIVTAPGAPERPAGWPAGRWLLPAAGGVVVVVVAAVLSGFHAGFPGRWDPGVSGAFTSLDNWVTAHQQGNFFFGTVIGDISTVLAICTNGLLSLLTWMTWVGVLAVAVVASWLAGGWRTASFSAVVVVVFGLFGLWGESMATLSLMAVSIALSVLVGLPLGVAAAVWKPVGQGVRPILDLMQMLPSYAYLVPVVILFAIGNPAGIVATFIYAVPPIVRFTQLGITTVRGDVVEAAAAFGATRGQVLRKVQLPLALQSILLGLNQVIMMALSVVVIASLVGTGGLGDSVLQALNVLNVGDAFTAGIVIVLMAMALDRASGAFGTRIGRSERRSRRQLALLWGGAVLVVLVAHYGAGLGDFPGGWSLSVSTPINNGLSTLQSNLYHFASVPVVGGTSNLSSFLTLDILNPLQHFLTALPWWVVLAAVGGAGYALGGLRRALLLGACVVAIGLMQVWAATTVTLSQVVVALALDLLIGIPLGIAAYRSKTVDRVLRPVLDLLQTMPAFVYLIPVVLFFSVGNVAGVIASLVYALPAAVRATTLGLRSVPLDVVEAGDAFGATPRQRLRKVELPLARPYLLLAVNQTIMLVLAEVIVAGLVGAGGLGYSVVVGLERDQFGQGLTAGLSIVLLGVIFDRLTQGSGRTGTVAAAT